MSEGITGGTDIVPFIPGFIVNRTVLTKTNCGMYLFEVVQNFKNGESSMFQSWERKLSKREDREKRSWFRRHCINAEEGELIGSFYCCLLWPCDSCGPVTLCPCDFATLWQPPSKAAEMFGRKIAHSLLLYLLPPVLRAVSTHAVPVSLWPGGCWVADGRSIVIGETLRVTSLWPKACAAPTPSLAWRSVTSHPRCR